MESEALPPLGFIAVACHFYRPPGDPFNDLTWPFPIIRKEAKGSDVTKLVTAGQYDSELIENFIEAGLELAKQGCVGIITSCGFIAMAQPELSTRLPIPISTSSLIQLPSLLAIIPPHKKILVLTYDASKLGPLHLSKLGLSETSIERILIRGAVGSSTTSTTTTASEEQLPTSHLQNTIAHGARYIHSEIESELLGIVQTVLKEYSKDQIGAVALECTQMPPFAEAIQKMVGKEIMVFDAYTNGCWFYEGLVRRRPERWGRVRDQ